MALSTANMTVATMPLRNDLPWYKFLMALSGVIYTLNVRFNIRMNRWILNIQDAQGNDIIDGIPLLINRDILLQYLSYAVPVGPFIVTDLTNSDIEATLYAFGISNLLYYFDPLGLT